MRVRFYKVKNDEELLERVRAGDTDAFGKMVCTHVKIAMYILKQYVQCYNAWHLRDELEGVAYSAIVHAVDRIRKGHLTHTNFRDYVAQFIRLHLKNAILKSRKEKQCECDRPNRDAEKDLWEAWQTLFAIVKNETEREIVFLRSQGFVDKEIADKLGVPKTTVFRIRKKLQQRYERGVK